MEAGTVPAALHRTGAGQIKYRPEIDGLRAFAVVAVIINHFNKWLLPSGYLGVDIFFVISGYVITSSLAGRKSKTFQDFLTGFYERRLKRLVPALLIFVLITSVLISLFNPDPHNALKTGGVSLFGLSNLYLLKQSTDYFAESTALNPFTHTWSLGVEEQFYLLFPMLIWFSGFGQQNVKGERNLFFWVGVLSVASLISFIYLYQVNQPAAYFLMPTRFWEMAAGCLIFIGFQKRAKMEQVLEQVPPLLVVIVMVGVMFLPTSEAVPATISMVALSGVLIACLKKGTLAYDLFTLEKVVYIGLISYSLYLWHWSVLSISLWTIGIHWWSLPIQVAAIMVMASLSYNLIEKPFRKVGLAKERYISILTGILSLSTGAALLFVLIRNTEMVYAGEKKKNYAGLNPTECFSGRKYSSQNLMAKCALPSRTGTNLIAIGDSQTGQLMELLNRLNTETGVGIRLYHQAYINFPALRETGSDYAKSLNEFDSKYANHISAFNTYLGHSRRGDVLIISSNFQKNLSTSKKSFGGGAIKYFNNGGNELGSDIAFSEWKSNFHNFVKIAKQYKITVVLFNSFPGFEEAPPKCVSDPQWFNTVAGCEKNVPIISRSTLLEKTKLIDDFFDELSHSNESVYVFDQFSALCPRMNTSCSPRITNDGIHLSYLGAIKLYSSFKSFLVQNNLL